MIDREEWGFRPHWLDWVNEVWAGRGRVEQQHAGHPSQAEFRDRAEQAFNDRRFPFFHVKTWVSVQVPENGEGYAPGYPHIHKPDHGLTLVHYLQTGDTPAPLDIFDGEDVIETVTPTPGLAVFMPNTLKHGVRKHHGPKPRIQLIATAI